MTKSLLIAVDTNVLLDQALDDADVLDALQVIRERLSDARLIVTPTVLEELGAQGRRGKMPGLAPLSITSPSPGHDFCTGEGTTL